MQDIKEKLHFGKNVLREGGVYLLPDYIPENGEKILVDCILMGRSFAIDGGHRPIKFKGRFGSRVIITPDDPNVFGMPKFVYDSKKDQWLLMTYGDICFAEQEIAHRINLSDSNN